MNTAFKTTGTFMLLLVAGDSYAGTAANENVTRIAPQNITTNMYLVPDQNGKLNGKVTLFNGGLPTTGGVTENLTNLQDFEIPVSKLNIAKTSELNLSILPKTNSKELCSQAEFKLQDDKIISTLGQIVLTTATNCEYEVFNTEGKLLATFTTLLNYTYKRWCENTDLNLEAYKTARMISPTCSPNLRAIFMVLDEKEISDLSPLSGFINIRNLWLMKNNISYVPLGIFDNLTELEWLSLFSNKIATLDRGIFSKLKKLQSIELSYNKLSVFPQDISNLTTLISFEISHNNIRELPNKPFDKLPTLVNLDLSNNPMSCYPKNMIKNNPELHFFNGVERTGNIRNDSQENFSYLACTKL